MQFVPSHCGVIGNELADSLAAEAASSDLPIDRVPFDFRMAQCTVNNTITRRWSNRCDQLHVHTLATRGGLTQKFHPSLSRPEEIQIARLRTGHHFLIKRPGLGLTNCLFCNKEDTDTLHLLSECPAVESLVVKRFPELRWDGSRHGRRITPKLHEFFTTERQVQLIHLLRDITTFLRSTPMRHHFPRQHFERMLIKYSDYAKLPRPNLREVGTILDSLYSATSVKRASELLWDVELYCFLNSSNEKYFSNFRNKIKESGYTRISRNWLTFGA
eukprot:TRINITY_DN2170_c2_g1_i2.p1 TRINITY_DN2170_c2_g1~~TRINITY_DN2170_c2_g1_i2.p1  ORF type:complete len:273 (+),score=-9.62 TRINITY_DN2170_c2_g1_i2:391-1209(+)